MKKFTLTLLLGISFMAFAQPKTDSLKSLLKTTSSDEKIDIYNQILNTLSRSKPQEAILLSNDLLSYADSISNLNGKASGLKWLGLSYENVGNYEDAVGIWKEKIEIDRELKNKRDLAYATMALANCLQMGTQYQQALEEFTRADKLFLEIEDKRGLGMNYGNMGLVYKKLGLFSRAVNHQYKALQIAEQLGDSTNIAHSLSAIAGLYFNLQDIPRAIENYTKAIEIYQRLGSNISVVHTISNLGVTYNTLEQNQKALETFRRGMALSNAINYPYGKAIVQMNIGEILLEMNQPDSALYYLDESNKTFNELNIPHPLCYNYTVLGNWYKEEGDTQLAIEYLTKAYELSGRIDAPDLHRDAAHWLSEIYETTGEFAKALQYQKTFKHYSDSLFNAENIATTARLESQYHFEKDQAETMLLHRAQLEKKQTTIIAATTAMLAISVLLVFVFFQYRSKNAAYKVLYKKNMEELKAPGNNRINEGLTNGELFKEIERKMKEEKLFTTKNLSRELIAEKLKTNHEYVQKAIKDHASKTVNEYINSYRIGEAMEILSDPIKMKNEKMANLVDLVGFNSISTYNKIFKEITGMPPSEFRKQSNQKLSKSTG